MKLIRELEEWITQSTSHYGDPATPVGQIFARFVTRDPGAHDDIVARWDGRQLFLGFGHGDWLPIDIDTDGMKADDETGHLTAFGVKQICPGFWTLEPSLNMPGVIHAFVHVYGVPAIAPWERRIIVVSSFKEAVSGR